MSRCIRFNRLFRSSFFCRFIDRLTRWSMLVRLNTCIRYCAAQAPALLRMRHGPLAILRPEVLPKSRLSSMRVCTKTYATCSEAADIVHKRKPPGLSPMQHRVVPNSKFRISSERLVCCDHFVISWHHEIRAAFWSFCPVCRICFSWLINNVSWKTF